MLVLNDLAWGRKELIQVVFKSSEEDEGRQEVTASLVATEENSVDATVWGIFLIGMEFYKLKPQSL